MFYLLTYYLLDFCQQSVFDVASRRHLRSAGRRLLNVPHQRRSILPGGLSLWLRLWYSRMYLCWKGRHTPTNQLTLLCGSVAGPLVLNSLPDYTRETRQSTETLLQAPKDVFVCSVLIHVQRIRAFTTMRDIIMRFTYLLTYLLPLLRNCAKILPFYPSKFSIQIRYTFFSPFRIKLLFGMPSKLLSKTRLIRDIYLAIQTYLLWTSRP